MEILKTARKLTPMMQQYFNVKSQYPDAIVFFRMGDFFEMFFEDAKIASEVLGIALTHRNKVDDNPIPMAGVPHHSYRSYVNRLTQEGWTVVICDQVEEAKPGKLVNREVTRIVTPGMVLDPDDLDSHDNAYLAAVFLDKGSAGIAKLDLSTGEFSTTEVEREHLLGEMLRISPKELLFPSSQREEPQVSEITEALDKVSIKFLEDRAFELSEAKKYIAQQFDITNLDSLGLKGVKSGIRSAGAILSYVRETQRSKMPHIGKLRYYTLKKFLILDHITRTNLEILESAAERTRRGSLWWQMDFTLTNMGRRKLKQWLLYPLVDIREIQLRLDVVEALFQRPALREQLRESLKKIRDLERLNSKVASKIASPRDLFYLRLSLEAVPHLKGLLAESGAPPLVEFSQRLEPLPHIASAIRECLVDDPPAQLKDGNFIREGFSPELDEYRDIAAHGKDRLLEMQERERRATGIQSLKIKYNKVFGYFIEVSKPNLHLVPKHYIRKQTMVNHERFFTEELKEFETKILEAEEKISEIENRLFAELREKIAAQGAQITELADNIAELDVLVGFAELAEAREYVRPELREEPILEIEAGRHPVVEARMKAGEFVPNDLTLDEESRFVLLTGPNMAGKSTIMRQVALIALMAQVGSFVPAKRAVLGLCDRIFTRVGASDNIAEGQSTFMVEMVETANILNNATSKSLVILDEIGRGTSTFDGISIAWAVAEYIHNKIGCRTLFATHYHELTELEFVLPKLKNMNVAIHEWNGQIHFLHKLQPGASNRSYGIQVARLAGLPRQVIHRAQRILGYLEGGKLPTAAELGGKKKSQRQLSLFAPVGQIPPSPLERELRELDVEKLTPIDALQLLYRWKSEYSSNS